MRLFLKFIFGIKLYMFRTFPLSIISSLFTVHTAKVYVIQLASRIRTFRPDPARKLSANLYDIYRCCGYSEKTPDDGQRSCPKHAEFYSKNKFEKLVHLVGFIIRIYHDARSPERNTIYHNARSPERHTIYHDARSPERHTIYHDARPPERHTIYHDARSPERQNPVFTTNRHNKHSATTWNEMQSGHKFIFHTSLCSCNSGGR